MVQPVIVQAAIGGYLDVCIVQKRNIRIPIHFHASWTALNSIQNPKSLRSRNSLKKHISDLENDLKKCPHVSVNQDVGLDWCLLHHCIINIDSSQSDIKNWAIFQLYCLFLVLLHPPGGLARGLEKIKLVELCSL